MLTTADLGKTYPRRFVPPDADMGNWAHIEPLYRRLLEARRDSPEALERWIEDTSELYAAVAEEGSRRYVAMTCQTDDPERERAHLFFIEEIHPKVKPLGHALDEAYLGSVHRAALPPRYAILDRSVQNRAALFRLENIPLETEEAKLKQQYQKINGAMTVTFRGKEHTLQQMARYLEETDRSGRQEAWELVARRRLRDEDAIEAVFEQLLGLRDQIARNAGCADYREYAFRRRERFDYTPQDCLRFHDAIEEAVLPLARRLRGERRTALGLPTLRPWDLEVDPHGRPPLRPFSTAAELVAGSSEIFDRVHPDLGTQFRFMSDRSLLDLESRKGKAPGGYQATFEERRVPFIFMNAVGRDLDLRTIIHEGGHAFHTLAVRDEPIAQYRHAPMEFSEVASMGMELLASPYLDTFYRDQAAARRSRRELLEGTALVFPWIATIDAFPHWLYTHPGHARAERRAAWLRTFERFAPDVDFTGYDDVLGAYWHRQLHLFVAPFYYVEYGVAQIGALQVWRRARADQAGAVRQYREALTLGGREPLPALFAAAGAEFDLTTRTLGPVMKAVADFLDELDAADRRG
ncbi:MAG: M3 family oligoendopeptidase [Armatimonadota bacterium]